MTTQDFEKARDEKAASYGRHFIFLDAADWAREYTLKEWAASEPLAKELAAARERIESLEEALEQIAMQAGFNDNPWASQYAEEALKKGMP